jgi:hypothetical protein
MMAQINVSQVLNGIDGKPLKDGTEPEGIDYGRLVALLLGAIKEQQSQIHGLAVQIDAPRRAPLR